MPNDKFFKKVSDLIAKGKVTEAIQTMEGANPPTDIANQLVLLKGRWTKNETDQRMGVLSRESYGLERNKIVNALLATAREIEPPVENRNPLLPASPPPSPPHSIESLSNIVNLFWMYDESAEDSAQGLKNFFKVMERNGEIDIFDMVRDVSGDREAIIAQKLNAAHLVICIVTPLFVVNTLERAEHARRDLNKPVVPILMEEVSLEGTLLEGLVSLPRNPKYATQFSSPSAAYLNIFQDIKNTIHELKK